MAHCKDEGVLKQGYLLKRWVFRVTTVFRRSTYNSKHAQLSLSSTCGKQYTGALENVRGLSGTASLIVVVLDTIVHNSRAGLASIGHKIRALLMFRSIVLLAELTWH